MQKITYLILRIKSSYTTFRSLMISAIFLFNKTRLITIKFAITILKILVFGKKTKLLQLLNSLDYFFYTNSFYPKYYLKVISLNTIEKLVIL